MIKYWYLNSNKIISFDKNILILFLIIRNVKLLFV